MLLPLLVLIDEALEKMKRLGDKKSYPLVDDFTPKVVCMYVCWVIALPKMVLFFV